MIKNCDVYNVTAKMAINIEAFTYSGRHIGFPVGDILSLNALFCRGDIFRKSHNKTPLHLYRFQRYEHESGLGGNLPPPVGHRRVMPILAPIRGLWKIKAD